MLLERDSLLEWEKMEQDAAEELVADASEAREEGRKNGSAPAAEDVKVSLVVEDTLASGELGSGSGGVGVGHREVDECCAAAAVEDDDVDVDVTAKEGT